MAGLALAVSCGTRWPREIDVSLFSASVVVPAWNEAKCLPALLESFLAQGGVTLDVVVVANGCVDGTAAAARAFDQRFARAGHRLRVLELAIASKPAALRLGDEALEAFPRAYIDADVVLSPDAIRRVAVALEATLPRVAAPRLRFSAPADTARLAAFIEGMPPFSDDVVGGGFYAVNESGRGRWASFPDVIADDTFVLSHFTALERQVVPTVEFRCRFPSHQRLADVLTRWEIGRLQLANIGVQSRGSAKLRAVLEIAIRPRLWLSGARWFGLKRAARDLARRRFANGDLSWSRADDT